MARGPSRYRPSILQGAEKWEVFGDSGHDVRKGKVKFSYQLEQDYLRVDRVRNVIVITIYLRCDNLGLIAGDLGHANLHADGTPVIDRAWQRCEVYGVLPTPWWYTLADHAGSVQA